MPTDRPADRHPLTMIERIESRIHVVRDQKVILDADLAELYGVPTKRLNEQVKHATWTGFRRISCSG